MDSTPLLDTANLKFEGAFLFFATMGFALVIIPIITVLLFFSYAKLSYFFYKEISEIDRVVYVSKTNKENNMNSEELEIIKEHNRKNQELEIIFIPMIVGAIFLLIAFVIYSL